MADEGLKFGEQELLRLFGGKDVGPYLEWRDGVGLFVKPLSALELEPGFLSPEMRRLRLEHPTGDLDVPALPFPCTLAEFRAFIALKASRLTKIEDWALATAEEVTAFEEEAPHAAVLVRMIRGANVRGANGSVQARSEREAAFRLALDREGGSRGHVKRLAAAFGVDERTIRNWKRDLAEADNAPQERSAKALSAGDAGSALQSMWQRKK
jgi:hypothetical protein